MYKRQHDIKASAIVAITTSGYTAEMMAKYKPVEPIIAATPDSKTYHQQALTRGVYPCLLYTSIYRKVGEMNAASK